MGTDLNLGEFLSGFLMEAEEHLHSVNRNLVATGEALKNNRPEPRAVRELFRSVHTIKGLSAMVGAEPIVEITHELETILRTADRAGGRISEEHLHLILQGVRAVEERVQSISRSGLAGLSPAPVKLLEELTAAQGMQPSRPAAAPRLELPEDIQRSLSASDREQLVQAAIDNRQAVMVEFSPSPANAAAGLNITAVRAKLAGLGEIVKVVPRSSARAPTGISFILLLITEAPAAELALAVNGTLADIHSIHAPNEAAPALIPAAAAEPSTAEVEASWQPSEQATVRVDVRRLDEVLEQLSTLFVNRFKLERVAGKLADKGVDTSELKAVLAENSRQLKRLRTAISEARMVPLAELLQRLPLVVRGITKDSDKTVNVTIVAGSAEVDKAVADKIFPAVVHLVRNAVDHALENREERRRAGKPEAGEISIRCDDSSGVHLVLEIKDDGRGIDPEAVARKSGRPLALNEEELLSQICLPGLSTSAALTTTSGRGMGMDIVKRTAELLGGSLSLNTTPGQGTSFLLTVPVTITIVDVLSFEANGQVFVAPMASVEEIIEIDRALIVSVPATKNMSRRPSLIQHRGRAIPLFALHSVLHDDEAPAAPKKALVIKQGSAAVAFGVDRLLGKQEAVVRPLDDALLRIPGMSGATDLGDGRPTLVLDLSSLGKVLLREPAVTA
ncbi:MAG: chemotaxis protein CheA [Proteobacteria bacterium]|nr:MAG: chemotaxis protein CheA [Pseudomonadota bacterium]